MKGKDYFILAFTFLTGMSAGAYLYVTSFAPSYEQDTVQKTEEIVFLLQGQKRGDCNQDGDVCPSFELREDRSYTFIPRYVNGSNQGQVVQGTLGKDRFDTLLAYIDTLNLQALEELTPGACSALYDTNYSYHLVYQGTSYEYDTCNTAFKESVLAAKFYPLWTRLATSTPTAPLLEGSFSNFLKKQLRKQFDTNDTNG